MRPLLDVAWGVGTAHGVDRLRLGRAMARLEIGEIIGMPGTQGASNRCARIRVIRHTAHAGRGFMLPGSGT
ncbi:hypothetical protein CEG14_10920 [Bordetella genomosp. 1]|uniref:Uncharacterized protein n=1 Tax=Bordetella genomosp. 1 TaxID=1395607 RepID=A0A261SEZ3_9BORD|nr:hypothetical protein CEG14_10920 [Bordetella genomosp. 1]